MLKEAAKGAAAIVAIGTCAAFGGIPQGQSESDRRGVVSDIIKDKPIINIPGCPPIPVVMTGVLAHYLTFGTIPELDDKGRPDVLLRRHHPRPLLSPAVLRSRQVCQDLRRRRRAQGLVPVRTRLQGPDHVQRLRHHQMESRRELPDGIRSRLPRLFRTGFLGCGRFLHRTVDAGRSAAIHRSRRCGGRRGHRRGGECSPTAARRAPPRPRTKPPTLADLEK